MRHAARVAAALGLTLTTRVLGADPPERPEPRFFVEAARRFLTGERASVTIRTSVLPAGTLALYRVLDPRTFALGPLARADRHFAITPTGRDMERLLVEGTALPRRGDFAELLRLSRVTIPADERPRAWNSAEVDLGPLRSGLYLARITAGGWAATAAVSVGSIVMLVRRGDRGDRVFVTDAEGAPQRDVVVLRRAGTMVSELRTDATGSASFAPSGADRADYVATRGDDVATAEVTHVRESPCDVRVYLDSGRTNFFPNESMHLRGHVRGCGMGADRPLANEPVELRGPTTAPFTMLTDAGGNFVADAAPGCVQAIVRGRAHSYCASVEASDREPMGRPWPRRAAPAPSEGGSGEGEGVLAVRAVSPRVGLGDPVEVDLRSCDGGTVLLTLEQGGVIARANVNSGGTTRATLPTGAATVGYASVVAIRVAGGVTSTASSRLWIGPSPDLDVGVTVDSDRVRSGEPVRVTVRAHAVDGAARNPVLSLWLSDARWWVPAGRERIEPGEYLRLPERRTDSGEGVPPGGAGADEGRRHDPMIEWNGRRLPGLDYRATWESLHENVNLDVRGNFSAVARALAVAMGRRGAEVCPRVERALGTLRVRIREVPDDLIVPRITAVTGTRDESTDDRLVLGCIDDGVSTTEPGSGTGWGEGCCAGGGRGFRSRRSTGPDVPARPHVELPPEPGVFVGTRRTEGGEAVFDLMAPAVPGVAWRVEVLAIDEDGRGAHGHATFATY